jgi:hypothetical protein
MNTITPKISLTDFVDIVSKSGTPKATKVAQVKERPDYEPAFDFYKSIREQIVDIHKNGLEGKALYTFLQTLKDRKKKANYPEIVDGYLKWLGRKQVDWFNPSRENYLSNGVEVIVNPELGLTFKGEMHLIKLYFKDEALSRFRVDVILSLMEHVLRPYCQKSSMMSVMDVRRGKLFSWRELCDSNIPLVDAELAYVGSLWPRI